MTVDYDPYSYSPPDRLQQQQQPPQEQSLAAPRKDHTTTPLSPPKTHISQFQNQQRSPPPGHSQSLPQAPTIGPTSSPATSNHQIVPKPYLATNNLSQPNLVQSSETNEGLTASPVQNPFQIHALRNQAQGVNVPQMRRPVPGSGNSFAQQQQQQQQQQKADGAEMIRPPRGDSLPSA